MESARSTHRVPQIQTEAENEFYAVHLSRYRAAR